MSDSSADCSAITIALRPETLLLFPTKRIFERRLPTVLPRLFLDEQVVRPSVSRARLRVAWNVLHKADSAAPDILDRLSWTRTPKRATDPANALGLFHVVELEYYSFRLR